MNVMETVKQMETTVRARFGADITLSLARCPAFGNTDMCFIVNGTNHAEAARSFTHATPGATVETEHSCGFMDIPAYDYSVVTVPGPGY